MTTPTPGADGIPQDPKLEDVLKGLGLRSSELLNVLKSEGVDKWTISRYKPRKLSDISNPKVRSLAASLVDTLEAAKQNDPQAIDRLNRFYEQAKSGMRWAAETGGPVVKSALEWLAEGAQQVSAAMAPAVNSAVDAVGGQLSNMGQAIAEQAAHLGQQPRPHPGEIRLYFNRLDGGDGKIDFNDLVAAPRREPPGGWREGEKERLAQAVIDALDGDRDGQIDIADFRLGFDNDSLQALLLYS
ncbi:MAG: hypothetical protein FJZ01_26845 [Candidatus Sericytochromatia bacterium]|nr:hypothetical protein [Candidatus Tanganyikabacteria bacterium]